jgi:hypothetical protein
VTPATQAAARNVDRARDMGLSNGPVRAGRLIQTDILAAGFPDSGTHPSRFAEAGA